MKKNRFYFIPIISLLSLTVTAQNLPQLGKASIEEVIAAMTLEEKATLVVGPGMSGSDSSGAVVGVTDGIVAGAAGNTSGIPRLGIPAIVMADGPAGLRISPAREGTGKTFYCTAFPIATAIATSWNIELMEELGKIFGNEVHEYGVDVLLAPGMNIMRNPLCGRNFEYYSEDPLLSGKMGAAFVRGVQSNGVGTSIKHFAANNQETNRMYMDSRVSERALREIYLKGFEIAVKEGNPYTIMSSYNKINGVYASHNKWLLTDVVRGEWDYKGLVVTDWFGGKDGAAMIAAGNNLIMPGTTTYKRAIIRAIEKGKLSMDELDASVRRVLELILKSPRFNKYAYSDAPDLKSHAEFVRNADTECMVLLENKEVLPLAKSVKNIAVYGVGSYDYIIGGTGSGDVNEAYTVSLAEGLANAGYKLNIELKDAYTKHIKKHYEPKPQVTDNKEGLLDGSAELAKFLPQPRPAELLYSANELKVQAKQADVAIITISRVAGEFADRRLKGDFELSDEEQNLIKNVSDAFHAKGKKIVVVLNVGGVVETSSWKSIPDAVLLAWQGGQEAGNSIADILSGKFSPSGKLPMTFPIRFEDAGSSANFPVDYTPANQMELAMGRSNVKPEKYIRNVDFTNYDEGIYVGYRWFDTKNINVSYPFGYGLSYTKFEYSDAKISVADGNYTVVCTVRNAGNTAGKEVVQLYVSAPGNTMDKPAKELKAFAKTQNLQPNESQTVELKITREQLASFDENAKRWIVESGEYKVLIGTSSQDIKQTVNLKL